MSTCHRQILDSARADLLQQHPLRAGLEHVTSQYQRDIEWQQCLGHERSNMIASCWQFTMSWDIKKEDKHSGDLSIVVWEKPEQLSLGNHISNIRWDLIFRSISARVLDWWATWWRCKGRNRCAWGAGDHPMEKLGFQTPKTVYFMVMCRQSSLGFKKNRIGRHTMFFYGPSQWWNWEKIQVASITTL